MSQYGIKNVDPAFQSNAGFQITPDEIDRYEQFIILHPGVGTATVGTASGSGASGAITLLQTNMDYPRNLQVIATGLVGTVVINGQDQFGGTLTETISGGTSVGTSVFARIGTATYTKPASAGTIEIGYAIGTSAASPLFGLPFRVGSTADVKTATWIDNDVAKQLNVNGAAPGITVNTNTHSVRIEVSGGIAAADSFVIMAKPSYNASGDNKPQAGL